MYNNLLLIQRISLIATYLKKKKIFFVFFFKFKTPQIVMDLLIYPQLPTLKILIIYAQHHKHNNQYNQSISDRINTIILKHHKLHQIIT